MPAYPQLFRRRMLFGGSLNGGQSSEIEVDLSQECFIVDGKRLEMSHDSRCRWLDLLLTVQFRDRSGFLRELRYPMTTVG